MQNLFDAHLHIIDPRFPLVANKGYQPPPFTVADYLAQAKPLGITGGVVVSGSFQAFDQTYLISALEALGKGFVGVTQLPTTVSDDEILSLDRIGVRALRFHFVRGKDGERERLNAMAMRVHELCNWHVELYIESRMLGAMMPDLRKLPAYTIDHLGLTREGFNDLLTLVEKGAHVKASGFGRVELDVRSAIRDICAANPAALMFGTDLPSTRAPRAFQANDIAIITDCLDTEQAQRVLHDNAIAFYCVSGHRA